MGLLAITALAQESGAPMALPHRNGPGGSGVDSLMLKGTVTVPAETEVRIQMPLEFIPRLTTPMTLSLPACCNLSM